MGEWKDSIKKGIWLYFVPTKFIYFGEFDSNPCGFGKFISIEHRISYEGMVKEGKICGKGKLTHL